MKKIFLLLILCLICIPFIGNAIVKPSNIIYVTDEAGVLKEHTKNYIIEYSDFLSRAKKINFYVVTVPYLGRYEIKEYADYVFESFKMGEKGVLVFFSKEENAIQIILGTKISNSMSDSDLDGYINNYFLPYFKNMEWDKGIKNGYSALYKKICDYYQIDASELKTINGNSVLVKYRYPILTGIIFLGMIIGYFLCRFFKRMYTHTIRGILDYLFFIIVFILNMALFGLSYYIEPWSLIMLIGVELFTIITTFDTSKNMSLEEALTKIKTDEARKQERMRRKAAEKRKKEEMRRQQKMAKKRKTM